MVKTVPAPLQLFLLCLSHVAVSPMRTKPCAVPPSPHLPASSRQPPHLAGGYQLCVLNPGTSLGYRDENKTQPWLHGAYDP